MMERPVHVISLRQKEIVKEYVNELNKHIEDLKNGQADHSLEIKDFADLLHIHPRHLSNTIYEVLGQSPCSLYESRLMEISKDLLLNTNEPIADIARRLTFDPSNFTKFFKRFSGLTPKQFREANKQ
jgi:AraC family transcriptional regulator, regulatory protein of adaptative response / methylphosphotriester-DNA alkyltransferase methyltransferase